MIYGFAYLLMIIIITTGWLFIAVLPKPRFIEKPLDEMKDKLRNFLGSREA